MKIFKKLLLLLLLPLVCYGQAWHIDDDGHWENNSDSALIKMGIDDDYTIGWDGSDAVHTISAGDFVLTGGNVGIGETAPQDKLEVNGAVIIKDKLKFTQDDGNEYIDSLNDGYMDYGATTAHRFNTPVRGSIASYRRYFHLSVGGFDPGASGATWTSPDANITGGWQLNASGEVLIAGTDIHLDWDGVSDITADIRFALNASGSANDTVDLKLIAYYNGIGDTATKTQTVEVATTTDGTQYKVYKVEFTIDFDAGGNVVDVGDEVTFILNLETDTSEIDDVVITGGSFFYNTTHIGIESSDI